jgi:hypothetical protein
MPQIVKRPSMLAAGIAARRSLPYGEAQAVECGTIYPR